MTTKSEQHVLAPGVTLTLWQVVTQLQLVVPGTGTKGDQPVAFATLEGPACAAANHF